MLNAICIGSRKWRTIFDRVLENRLGFVLFIWVDAENLTEITAACRHQLKPVLFGFRMGLLVRIDVTFAERLNPNAGHESTPREILAFIRKRLMVNINGPYVVGFQNSISTPLFYVLTSAIVDRLAVGQVVATIENQTNNIKVASLVELVLVLTVDNVIRGSHYIGEYADFSQIVSQSSKRLNICHGKAFRYV